MPVAARWVVEACRPGAPSTDQGAPLQRGKKILIWVLVAFAAYAIFTSPDKSANLVQTSGSILADGAVNVGHFFDALLGQ
jgi:hypothetical protein